MHAKLINPETGNIKEIKVGYAWTMLFFEFWVPIFRGDYKGGILLLGDIATGTFFSTIYGFFYKRI